MCVPAAFDAAFFAEPYREARNLPGGRGFR
jgi:hypothetical protein